VRRAREKGVLISYDPNYRAALWDSEEEAVRWMKTPLEMVDILKISDEELLMLTGTEDLEAGSRILAEYGISLVMITLGGEGVCYRVGDQWGTVPAVPVEICDTNGAGDTFLGAVLAQLAGTGSIPAERAQLEAVLTFANRAAAVTCSRAGAIPAMPTLEELGESQ